jgi:S1-C subfamily serine protease
MKTIIAIVLLCAVNAQAQPRDPPPRLAPPPSDKSLSAVDIFIGASESIVRIETNFGVGTGFVIEDKRGGGSFPYIVTAKHVIENARSIRCILQHQGFGVDMYTPQKDCDLAFFTAPKAWLRACGIEIKMLPIRLTNVQPGETVFVIGYALGLPQPSITRGIVSALYSNCFVFDASISSGNSGAPVLDANGEVLGIVSAATVGKTAFVVENLNFATPIGLLALDSPGYRLALESPENAWPNVEKSASPKRSPPK